MMMKSLKENASGLKVFQAAALAVSLGVLSFTTAGATSPVRQTHIEYVPVQICSPLSNERPFDQIIDPDVNLEVFCQIVYVPVIIDDEVSFAP